MGDLDLAILGCGNMGLAIVRGAIAAGVLAPHRVLGVDPSAEARARMEALGARSSAQPVDARGAARLLLAVKPQSFDAPARSLAPLDDRCEVISVMSGWTRERIGASLRLRDGARRVTRAMPNLPVTIGLGVTAIAAPAPAATALPASAPAPASSAPAGVGAPDATFAERLFRAVGEVIFVEESLLDAVTAVSGSGPAYAFLLAESMMEAARRLGFDDGTARRLVVHTLEGAAGLLRRDGRDPADLRSAVTSRGGTTEAATGVWIERGVPEAIVESILAAARRASELGRGG